MTKSQSLERGLMVLELLNGAERPMGTREISRALDLSPAIVQRLLNALNEKHYVRKDEATRRYSVGYQVLGLGAKLHSRDTLLLEGRSALSTLSKTMGVDTFLAVLQGSHAIYLLSLPGSGPISLSATAGQTIQLHNTAIGKAILASFSDQEAKRLLGQTRLEATTPKTITDPNRMIAQLADVRRTGFAAVVDETVVGITSVGTFVGDPSTGMRAAISAAFAPHFAPELQIEQLASAVKEAARSMTRSIVAN